MEHHMHSHDHSAHSAGDHHVHMAADFKKRFFVSLTLSVPVLFLSPFIQRIFGFTQIQFFGGETLSFFLATIIYFYGGLPFLKGIREELREKRPGMMTLVAVAISAAFWWSVFVFFGYPGKELFWELATLIDVMLLGHWLEMKSVMGAGNALRALARLMPKHAHKIISPGIIEDVPQNALTPGDAVLIKPGEIVPADGFIIEGGTSINESMLTGESKPVEKKKGDSVIGGSQNNEGSLTVLVTKTGKSSYLARVIDLVEKAQAAKSETQRLADRAARMLTFVALGGGGVTLFAWSLIFGQDFDFALERTIAVIVIACPHALGLAIPLVVSFSTSLAAQHGLLIQNRTAFENLRRIKTIVFDKTGTLTKGEFSVSDVIPIKPGETNDSILAVAGSLEAHSEHPIAQAIAASAKEKLPVQKFRTIPGKGAEGIMREKKIHVVSRAYMREQGIPHDHKDVTRIIEEGKTISFVLSDGELLGAIGLDDTIRMESKKALEALKKKGVTPIMITGDNVNVAKRISEALGISEYFSEVPPDQKAAKIAELQSRGIQVAMVGDGINDAPALAQADVGIAIGAGSDIAAQTADIILVKSNLEDALRAMELSRRTYGKMVQNLWWAAGYNIFALPLAAGILAPIGLFLNPAIGAFFMSLSTIIVAANASLLKKHSILANK